MNQSFLNKIAQHVLDRYGNMGNRLCIVLPNRRAGLFLKRHLTPRGDTPIWSPVIFSMEDFTAYLSGFATSDPLELMTTLFQAHQSVEGAGASDFDGFYGWGRGLISDFEDIDQYLIAPTLIFTFLSETKAMSMWNADQQQLTDFQKQYLNFFNSLPAYYEHFTKSLKQRETAYHGLSCRTIAENAGFYCDKVPFSRILFAGFNALTPAQQKIAEYFIENEKAEILWDADVYYLENEHQEAGLFLRKYRSEHKLGSLADATDSFKDRSREIVLAGVPRMIGQAHLAGSIIKKLTSENNREVLNKTAVVLADESLLLPVLNAMPEEAGEFNVTMGFPLHQSPAYNLFDSIFEMHVNAVEGKSVGELQFYHRHLLTVLHHSYLQYFSDQESLTSLINAIRKNNTPFLSFSMLGEHCNSNAMRELLKLMMQKPDSLPGFIRQMTGIINLFRSHSIPVKGNERPINRTENEILFHISLILNKLHDFVVQSDHIGELQTLHALFREAASASPVAFYGEPLQGIQVMGMLETRVLDFENIILLSANEGTLPSAKSYNSFIPFDIRREFGLPTHQEHQAIFAYHFYRLLQRCSNAWLIYNTEADTLGGGERSRFLNQIAQELPIYSPVNKITEIRPVYDNRLNMPAAIEVQKDAAILEKLKKLAESGFSPTALNQYLRCTLQYYFTYVLGLGESDEVEETIDYRTLGTVVHEVLQKFYEPFLQRFPLEPDYKKMLTEAENTISNVLGRNFPGGEVSKGKNLLIIEVAKTWIRRFLEDEANAGYDITQGDHLIALEKRLKTTIDIITAGSEPLTVTLKGSADRIDRVNGITRIIDYKTGKVEKRELEVDEAEELFTRDANMKEKAFQLMFYLLLCENEPFANTETQAGIISFRSLKKGFFPLRTGYGDTRQMIDSFKANLRGLLEEMFDPEIPFLQTEFREQCVFCPFQAICNRFEKKGW